MECPLCKKAMKLVRIGNVMIDECADGCHGLWFDIKELQSLDEKHEGAGKDLERILGYGRAKDDDQKRRVTCPLCKVEMDRHEYIDRSKIYIDECFNCGGIWLDKGELAAIRENFKGYSHVEDVVERMLAKDPVFKKYLGKQGQSKDTMKKLLGLSSISR
jgi:uncharacterized protein